MAIDKLSASAGIIAALRAELSQRSERTGQKGSKRTETPASAPAAKGDIKVLRQQLADIVKPIAIDDAVAVRAVRPKVVRAILLWQFGASLREHPEWQPMLESILQTLENHPPHQAEFLKLLSDLKR